jgi:hypothetical protein
MYSVGWPTPFKPHRGLATPDLLLDTMPSLRHGRHHERIREWIMLPIEQNLQECPASSQCGHWSNPLSLSKSCFRQCVALLNMGMDPACLMCRPCFRDVEGNVRLVQPCLNDAPLPSVWADD